MSSESWINEPPRLLNPSEAEEATKVLRRPVNEPAGHTDLKELRAAHIEEISPSPARLDHDKLWFFPGLAYCMMRMDRSLFELYSWATDKAVSVMSYRADKPIALFHGADISDNPWFYTVQGVDQGLGKLFSDYISTYRFRDSKRNAEWRLVPTATRIADPFANSEGIDVTLLLPANLTSNRRVVIVQEPGLRLQQLILGVVSE